MNEPITLQELIIQWFKDHTLLKHHFSAQIDQIFVMPCCASLAVHAGPGALAIAIQEYEPLTNNG